MAFLFRVRAAVLSRFVALFQATPESPIEYHDIVDNDGNVIVMG